ncbi:MAG: hypothetical protein MRY32_03650 [Rickettsiales bacterium]|nr:hypothetical protein [Rickettsiales bacterium]
MAIDIEGYIKGTNPDAPTFPDFEEVTVTDIKDAGFEKTSEAITKSEGYLKIGEDGKIISGKHQANFQALEADVEHLKMLKETREMMPEGSARSALERDISATERRVTRSYNKIQRGTAPMMRAQGKVASAMGKDLANQGKEISKWAKDAGDEIAKDLKAGTIDAEEAATRRAALTERVAEVRSELKEAQASLSGRHGIFSKDVAAVLEEAETVVGEHGVKGKHTAKLTGEAAAAEKSAVKGAEKGGLVAFAKNRPLLTAAGGAVLAYAAARALGIIGGGNQAQQM